MNDLPQSLFQEDPWRIFRIMAEFVDSFEELSKLGPAVTVFGSARVKPHDKYYGIAERLARELARHRLSVITGGGPGIMEGANKGATEGNTHSVGLNITLPVEQKVNKYANVPMQFRYFFARKVCFVKYSIGFVFLPGGYGTLDEFYEVITLIQTQRIPMCPVILIGRKYWTGLLKWMKQTVEGNGFINPEDIEMLTLTEDPSVAVEAIVKYLREVGPPRTVPKAFC